MNDNIIVHITARLFAEEKCYGPGVHRLLGAVAQNHSLRAAAASMNMAYSKAWSIVRAAEQGFGCKLLRSTIGGSGGGGAQLTDEARQIMEAYDAYCRKLDAYGQELFRELFGFCTEKKKGRPEGRPFCGHQMVGISIPRRRYMVFFTALRMFSYPVQRHR